MKLFKTKSIYKKAVALILLIFAATMIAGLTESKAVAAANLAQINGTRVNMRAAPDMGARVVFQFPGYEMVKVLAMHENLSNYESYKWVKVAYRGHVGWVYGKYIR